MLTFIISVFVLIVDQYTKIIAMRSLASGPIEVIKGIFNLTLVHNTGAAFGILQNARWFFLFSTPLIIIAIIAFLILNKDRNILTQISLALIIGGALGNYADRLRYGYVIDFFDFMIWPVFNVADSCVVIGTILFAWYIYFSNGKNIESINKKKN